MFYVYLLQSLKDSTYYIGYTSDLRKRFEEHNSGKTKSIKHKIPLKLVYYEAYLDKTMAIKREFELKHSAYKKEELIKRNSISVPSSNG